MDSIENDLIKQLRAEANEVKKCFTNFAFAAITFSASVFGVIAGTVDKYVEVSFAAVPVVALLMVVCRIGIYKYSTANRNYGYELHLARLASFGPLESFPVLAELKKIEWEEVLRAWRVVQTAIFRSLYRVSENTSLRFLKFIDPRLYKLNNKKEVKTDKSNLDTKTVVKKVEDYLDTIKTTEVEGRKDMAEYPWFMPHLLSWDKDEEYSSYHAGSYLQNMMAILVLMQVFLMLPMLYLVIAKWQETGILYLLTLVVMSALIGLRYIRIERRRILLENEILSIHSCGVVWQAVALAHLLARKGSGVFCEHYTELLIGQCKTIKSRLFDIHRWFNEEMRR
jgi:hypothetical protein